MAKYGITQAGGPQNLGRTQAHGNLRRGCGFYSPGNQRAKPAGKGSMSQLRGESEAEGREEAASRAG